MEVKRGDIYFADCGNQIGHIQAGIRPVIIVQNDVGNHFAPTVIAIPISCQIYKAHYPTHILLRAGMGGLPKDSIVLAEQMRVMDKFCLKTYVGHIDDELTMKKINCAIVLEIGLVAARS